MKVAGMRRWDAMLCCCDPRTELTAMIALC